MAGEWIKVRIDLWDDPAVGAVCEALDCGEAPVVGALVRFWGLADAHTCDGLLRGMSAAALDRKTGLPGFSAALEAAGWLEVTDDGLQVTDFSTHNGKSAKKRSQDAKRQSENRTSAERRKPSGHNADEKRTDDGQNADNGQLSAKCREPSAERRKPSGHNADEKRETGDLEKRREDLEKKPPSPPQASAPAATESSGGDGWWVVVANLKGLRDATGSQVVDVGGTLAVPKTRGVPVAEVLAIVEAFHARPTGTTLGMLCWRIKQQQPGDEPTEGWPPPDEKLQSRHRAEATKGQDAAETVQRQAGEAATKAANQAREATLGPVLDAMPDSELESIAEGLKPAVRTLFGRWDRAGPPVGMVRAALLDLMAIQYHAPPEAE